MTKTSKNYPLIQLTSSRLRVEIAEPGLYYSGSRFDWTGFITKVTLDERHNFCVTESMIPGQGSGGAGLCNEFGINDPIGYDDAKPGDLFPKLGVGLLKRPDEQPYDFFRPYEATPFPTQVDVKSNKASFIVEPLDCRGYAIRMHKDVTVSERQLRIDYQLDNLGDKPIQTTEYCHNFIGIDGYSVGPNYRLDFPYPIKVENPAEILNIQNNTVSWRETPTEDFYFRPKGSSQAYPHRWSLRHQPTGVTVTEESNFSPALIAVWGKGHVISPEVFIRINLEPKSQMKWARIYTFESLI
jgi:hypothetical protein